MQTLARIRDFIPYCRARPESIGSLPTDFKIVELRQGSAVERDTSTANNR